VKQSTAACAGVFSFYGIGKTIRTNPEKEYGVNRNSAESGLLFLLHGIAAHKCAGKTSAKSSNDFCRVHKMTSGACTVDLDASFFFKRQCPQCLKFQMRNVHGFDLRLFIIVSLMLNKNMALFNARV
jgi:hypothetical protein